MDIQKYYKIIPSLITIFRYIAIRIKYSEIIFIKYLFFFYLILIKIIKIKTIP